MKMNDSSYFESQTHPYQHNDASSFNLSYEQLGDNHDRYQEILDNLTSSRMLSSHLHHHHHKEGTTTTKSTTRQAETLRADPHASQRIYIETT